jgi:hypothetical protein
MGSEVFVGATLPGVVTAVTALHALLFAAAKSGVTASASITWTDVVRTIGSIISALAILVGGAFAYVKFARGRLLHARLDIALEMSEENVGGTAGVLIKATVTNSGTLRVTLTSDRHPLKLTLADQILWEDAQAAKDREVLWSEGVSCFEQDLLIEEGQRERNPDPKDPDPFLEPGEKLSRNMLVPLPDGDWIAYRVQLTVTARPNLVWRSGEADSWKGTLVRVKGQSDG